MSPPRFFEREPLPRMTAMRRLVSRFPRSRPASRQIQVKGAYWSIFAPLSLNCSLSLYFNTLPATFIGRASTISMSRGIL